ncbi:hypothetical protein Q4555_13210 [Octadecabacter sp. 1_MG-2023]|uniref:hypothetical protein n=1 Tax=unclassified Octadecabacter TaxID=196158 RepID=UPI001C08340F|nr:MULTISPECIES: hypothetical protein [unclassified Octadecabacter]MBU2993526.1 hypothetical protein [Octadecabacter sp. B2R22]MDO6735631.1 hypothetical protein [Octadecabacter sp. 1_MG-2023]
MNSDRRITVLTGDLVGSVTLGPEKVEQAMAALETAAKGMESWTGSPLRFTRHRGDGWQAVVEKPKLAIRAALMFRAALRSLGGEFDTYIGLAEGTSPDVIKTDLNKMTGAVFTLSGAALELIKASNPSIRMDYREARTENATLILADHISQSWTPTQAELMRVVLSPQNEDMPYTELAEIFGKSRQTIAKSLDAAGRDAFIMALHSQERELTHD